MKTIYYFFEIFIINTLLFSCTGGEQKYEERVMKNTVRRYTSTIAEVYRDFDVDKMKDVATEDEIKKVDVLILTMRMENKFLNAKLKGLIFKDIKKIDENTREVDTEEEWEYEHLSIKTHTPVDELKKVKYNMTYTLVKKDDRWLVKFVDYTESKGKRRDLIEEYQKFIKEREKER